MQIDSIRPETAPVGDLVRIFGIGLVDNVPVFDSVPLIRIEAAPVPLPPPAPDPGNLPTVLPIPPLVVVGYPPQVTLGGAPAPIQSFVPRDTLEIFREGVLTVWVPALALDASLATVISSRGSGSSDRVLSVTRADVFEPNETAPADLGTLDTAFRNPALGLEPTAGGRVGIDWYVFSTTVVQHRTITLSWSGAGPDSVFVGDSILWNAALQRHEIGPQAWQTGSGYACSGIAFRPQLQRGNSVVVSLDGLPSGSYHIIAFYDQPGGYGLEITPSLNAPVAPDQFEESDYCSAATPLSGIGSVTDLTIDNPGDVDWFRHTVPQGQQGDLIVQVTAANGSADLDLYLLLDQTPNSLPVLQSGTQTGKDENLLQNLGAGDYFLVVVDFAGVPTQYRLTVTLP